MPEDDSFAMLYSGCSSLSAVDLGFEDVGLSSYFKNWLMDTAAQVTGVMTVDQGLSDLADAGTDFTPSNWTVTVRPDDDGDNDSTQQE